MIRPAGNTRIFEEVHVIDENNSECQVYTREADPHLYVLVNIPEDAVCAAKVYHISRAIAGWHLS